MEIEILRVRGSLGERGEGRGGGGGKLVRCHGRDEEDRALSVYVYVCMWVGVLSKRSEAKRSAD